MTDRPESPRALLQRAQAHLQKNQTEKALKFCSRACQADKQDTGAWLMLAAIQARLGNLDEVIRCCRHALSLHPDHAVALFNLGVALQSQGKPDAAMEYYRKVVQLQPAHARAHLAMAEIFQQQNRLDEAGNACHQALHSNPGLTRAHFCLGHTRYLQGRYAEAAASYQEVLKADPNHVPTINNLGRTFEMAGETGRAIELFNRALGLMQNKGTAWCNLGRVYFNQKNLAAAEAAYQDAARADPANPEPHIYLGQIHLELGNREQARAAFRQALELDPAQRDAKYFLAILEDSRFSHGVKTDYVAGLFDDYADTFDHELVDKLQYRTPELIADAIRAVAPANGRQYDILDAGCGTGLCGPLLRDISRNLDGVDLSPKMVEKARAKGVYDRVTVGELTETLAAAKDTYDMIISADVFVYIGDLAEVFSAACVCLRSGGLLVFSTETMAGDGFSMRPSGRFAHSPDYITGLATANGLRVVSRQDCALRRERTSVIDGVVYVLQKDGDSTRQARTA